MKVPSSNLIVALASCALVIVTVAAIYWSLRGVRRDLWLRAFAEYTGRYAEIMRVLPSVSRDPQSSFSLDQLGPEERSCIENAIREYFNLASEELYLHRRGHIDHETWSLWCSGIQSVMRTPWICELWDKLSHEYYGYTDFQDFMKSISDDVAAEGAATLLKAGESALSAS